MIKIEFLYSLITKSHIGFCPICEAKALFVKKGKWLRDEYICLQCKSIPRQRAIIVALNLFAPEWKNLKIHESSPSGVSSNFIERNCSQYIQSQYFFNTPLGELKNGVRCENLEKMTFEDKSLDLIITQDVFEHVMNPSDAFREISRVLKPGGMHIFTMPWYPKLKKTVQRAKMINGEIEHIEEPIYHGNPIDADGSLVTYDWGIDFTDYVYANSGMFTTIYLLENKNMGLSAEFLEVFVSKKPEQSC